MHRGVWLWTGRKPAHCGHEQQPHTQDRGATGIISTVAGNVSSGDSNAGLVVDNGPATSDSLNQPEGITKDVGGNLYIAHTSNHRIRRVDAATSIVTTVAGNKYTDPVSSVGGNAGDNCQATNSKLSFHFAVAFDSSGNMRIPVTNNSVVRMVNCSGIIITFAGIGSQGHEGDSGPATAATLFPQSGVIVDPAGNFYIAETQNAEIRKVSPATKIISIYADYLVTEYTTPTPFQYDLTFYTGIELEKKYPDAI